MNGKWKYQAKTTGVQRYAQELHNAFDESSFDYSISTPCTTSRLKQFAWEQVQLSVESSYYDTLFCPSNMAPLVLPEHVRLVTTLHCLRFYFHPENYSPAFVAWYRYAIPQIIDRASTILTVSNITAAEIQRIYPAAVGKIEVVYPGVSSHFSISPADVNADVPSQPYWVYVGNSSPAKNLSVILGAMSLSKRHHNLVLIGVDKKQLEAMCTDSPGLVKCLPQVHALGHINDANRVASIVRGAAALLAPSLYESFDLPVAEAMACGTPVVASDTDVHGEIGGGAPLFVAPTCTKSWMEVMDSLSGDKEILDSMRTSGIHRASFFQWDKAASAIMSLLKQ